MSQLLGQLDFSLTYPTTQLFQTANLGGLDAVDPAPILSSNFNHDGTSYPTVFTQPSSHQVANSKKRNRQRPSKPGEEMNGRLKRNKKRDFIRQAKILRSRLLIKFPFLPPLPPDDVKDFTEAMIRLCQWERKCIHAIGNYVDHLFICGYDKHKIKLAVDAIEEFRLPVELNTCMSETQYHTLMDKLYQLGLCKHAS